MTTYPLPTPDDSLDAYVPPPASPLGYVVVERLGGVVVTIEHETYVFGDRADADQEASARQRLDPSADWAYVVCALVPVATP